MSLQRAGQNWDMHNVLACGMLRWQALSNYLHRTPISMYGKEDDEGLKFKGVIMMKLVPMGFGPAHKTTLSRTCGAPTAPLGHP